MHEGCTMERTSRNLRPRRAEAQPLGNVFTALSQVGRPRTEMAAALEGEELLNLAHLTSRASPRAELLYDAKELFCLILPNELGELGWITRALLTFRCFRHRGWFLSKLGGYYCPKREQRMVSQQGI